MSESKLVISALQWDLAWESPMENMQKVSEMMPALPKSDVVLLPEMFSTGFTMNPTNVAEPMDGRTVNWMKELASRADALLVGSIIIREEGNYFNRALTVHPSGEINYYDKRHLFSFAGEDKVYTSGNKRLIIEYKGFRICPMICYDLRFPVWSRNTEEIDVLIYIANWPHARVLAWDTLLRARSIENLCYTIGVNRIGQDANGLKYLGHTSCYDALGKGIGETAESEEDLMTVSIHKQHLETVRRQFRFLDDRDEFNLIY